MVRSDCACEICLFIRAFMYILNQIHCIATKAKRSIL